MLVLPADLTHDHAQKGLNLLRAALKGETGSVVIVDAAPLARFDSSALAVLIECRREVLHDGKTFAVHGLAPRLRELAGLYGIDGLLPEAVIHEPAAAAAAG